MRLSKSRFLAGLQCHKRLYLLVHQPEIVGEPDEMAQAKIDEGMKVGQFARALFQKGALVEVRNGNLEKAIAETSRLMRDSKTLAIFEATFDHMKVLVRVDILQRVGRGNGWKLIEVKSSSNRKDYYLADVAIQRFVLDGLGFKVDPCLMLLNREYVYDGKSYDLEKLFKIVDVTAETDVLMEGIPPEIQAQLEVLSQDTIPDIQPGPQCVKPFQCEFFNLCNKPVPADDISCLPRISPSKLEQLEDLGVNSIRDIPADFSLTKYQQHARVAAVSGKAWFSKDLKKKLGELKYPLYFMDFETLGPAIPRFAGMRPYDQIPFQWSVHVRRKPGSQLEHYEFLAEDTNDPRLNFLGSLLRVIGPNGHVIVYNQSFESGILGKLSECFPEYNPAIIQLQARLWDLLPVIRSHTYHMDYRGFFSIKDVLPALVPEMAYEGMGVKEGQQAGVVWDAMIHGRFSEKEKEKARQDLLAYCCQDTLAMVRLLEVLEDA